MHSKPQRDPIGQLSSKHQKTSASKDVDRLELSHIAGEMCSGVRTVENSLVAPQKLDSFSCEIQ